MNEKILNILAKLENYRQNLATGKQTPGSPDHVARICQAIVVEFAPCKSRVDWIAALKQRGYLDSCGQAKSAA